MKDYIETFRDNIELERVRKGFTQAEWAERLGMSLSAYKRLISGETRKVDFYFFERVYKATGRVMAELCGAEPVDVTLYTKLSGLSKTQKELIGSLVDIESSLSSGTLTVFVPVGNLDDGMIYNSANIETIEAPSQLHATCGIRITSNHLHPVYLSGDILLIKQKAPRDGDVGIFIKKDTQQVFIRIFKQGKPCQLVPINGHGTTIEVDPDDPHDMDQWIKFGIVISKLRR